MKITDLDFTYPERLVGTKPQNPTRVMNVDLAPGRGPQEITLQQLLEQIPAGDVLVINNTKVLKRRIFGGETEILFLSQKSEREWEVLFPSRKLKVGQAIALPGDLQMTLTKKGRPQSVELSSRWMRPIFKSGGSFRCLPIFKRLEISVTPSPTMKLGTKPPGRKKPGSFAAPTASLHFNEAALAGLKARGVQVLELTLHVGLGTFLPVTADDLDQHDMHEEYAEISAKTWQQIQDARKGGHKVWALGTTATRALESAANGLLPTDLEGNLKGFTKILIQPPYEFKAVDRLLTNFHQPQSTLLALVAAFAGLEKVKACYLWAIERDFRLFSYGDLSVWRK